MKRKWLVKWRMNPKWRDAITNASLWFRLGSMWFFFYIREFLLLLLLLLEYHLFCESMQRERKERPLGLLGDRQEPRVPLQQDMQRTRYHSIDTMSLHNSLFSFYIFYTRNFSIVVTALHGIYRNTRSVIQVICQELTFLPHWRNEDSLQADKSRKWALLMLQQEGIWI